MRRITYFDLILNNLSVASEHKLSSYGRSLYAAIGGLFFLLSIFYGLVQISGSLFFSKTSYYQFKIYRLSLIADSRKGCLYEVRCPKTTENLKANEVRPYGR